MRLLAYPKEATHKKWRSEEEERKEGKEERGERREGREKGKEEGCTVVVVQTPNPGCEDLERELEEDEKEEEKNR